MNIETRVRLEALELVVANLVADQLARRSDPMDAARRAIELVTGQVTGMHLPGADSDEQSQLRSRIGDAARSIIEMAMGRAVGMR